MSLTPTEILVIAGYGARTPVAEIGVQVDLQPQSVVSLATRLRHRGYYLPYFKPVTVNPRRPPPPRFTASGITPGGGRISATADSQDFVDAHIAAMVADDYTQSKEG